MQKYFEVEITQENIDNGRRSNCGLCPIALAVIDKATPMYAGHIIEALIGWGIWSVYIDGIDLALEGVTSKRARKFIEHFDKGLPVKPTTFRLHLT